MNADGNLYIVPSSCEIKDKLQPGVYSLSWNPPKGRFELEQKPNFTVPKKLYGDFSIINKWLKSWENTSKNLGILLSGVKGTGKTIASQLLAIQGNFPVILVSTSFEEINPVGFKDFLSSPELSGSMILIDEFEKVYSGYEAQNGLLALLDGSFNTHLLFMLIVNENRISEYFMNRLGRLKYHKQYSFLDKVVIDEIIEDKLINKEHADSVHQVFDVIGGATMDTVNHLITEMNLFNESGVIVARDLCLSVAARRGEIIENYFGKSFSVGFGAINIDPISKVLSFQRNSSAEIERYKDQLFVVTGFDEEKDEDIYQMSMVKYQHLSKEELSRGYEEHFSYNGIYSKGTYRILEKNSSSMLIELNNNPLHTVSVIYKEMSELAF